MARKTATVETRPSGPGLLDRLPPGASPFAGRRQELAALAAGAARSVPGRSRLLVLAGRPGSGRTALAVHFARSVAADYPDGLLHVRFSAPDGSLLEPGRAARILLEQLGEVPDALLPGTEEDPACEALREALTGRRVLLLLDDVREAAQLWPLLTEEPGCLLLATTAGPLTGIEDIDPVILGGLDQRAAVDLLVELVGGTRVGCDPVGAADLAEACAARPAALRLAAGWLKANPRAAVTDVVRELSPEPEPAVGPKARGAEKPSGRRPGKTPAGAARTADPGRAEPDLMEALGLLGPDVVDLVKGGAKGGKGAGENGEGARENGEGGQGSRGTGFPAKGDKGGRGRGRAPGAGSGGDGFRGDGPGGAGGRPSGPQRGGRGLLPADPVPVADSDPLLAAFELLHRTLPAPRARLLRALTLAPGQLADLRSASALMGCPAPEAAQALEQLAGQELLEREPAAADGTARYRVPGRLYPRLAELRAERDRPSEVELARARLLERLVRLVDSARMLLDPTAGPNPDPLPGPLRLRTAAQAKQWLLEERDQLLGAVEEAIGQGDLDGSAGRLVTALLRALPLTGTAAPADLHQLHALVLKVAERQRAPRRAAAALLNLGDLQAAAGRWTAAAERYHAALDRAREAGDEPTQARALEGAGGCYRALADPVRAADWYGRALALRQGLADAPAEARLLVRLAEAHAAQRRFDEALREYRAAHAVLRRLGDESAAAAVAGTLDRLRERLDGEWRSPVPE
ncbi:tetratricopeptide repeat protein [Kitasatospora camelliae]|uniref:Tetratricopeptide repeat protein n=1 Tax=Kitasatospora camelliae TaxID=3156397 RepID=A0AAU8JZV5_9ACTN